MKHFSAFFLLSVNSWVQSSNSSLFLVLWSTYMSRNFAPSRWCWDHYKWMGRLWDGALCQHEIQSPFTWPETHWMRFFFRFSHGLRGIYQTPQEEGFYIILFLAMFGNKWQNHLLRQYTLWANVPFSLTERDTWLNIVVSPEKIFYFW